MSQAGGCLCGQVRFVIDTPLAPIQVCHCSQCRKAQGVPFATNIPVETRAFRIVRGQELLSEFESSPGKFRVFCRRCGSPILSRRSALPDVVRIRAGILDELLDAVVEAHFHVDSQISWWPPRNDLPRYPGSAIPTPPSD